MASSCDTFVALPPVTAQGVVIFGKNSDRPSSEVQEVIHCEAKDFDSSAKLQCTYIEIPQVERTYAVVLSKPAWMWGAEMGANEKGVAIGNEAVWTKENNEEKDAEEKLLGMDLVRLGLERGATARESLTVITELLEAHGQGGRCYEDPGRAHIFYHNSFIIADPQEAWVLETAGKHWAAEKVTDGVRNISNQLSIGTKIDLCSEGLADYARSQGWWGEGDLDFSRAFSGSLPSQIGIPENEQPARRFECGKTLMMDLSIDGNFGLSSMFKVLRDEDGGICRAGKNQSPAVTTGSQVSVLVPPGADSLNCHWFTATPNPARSVFKPFFFCPDVVMGNHTKSPSYGDDDPVKVKPRFQGQVNREHALYKSHKVIKPLPGTESNDALLATLGELEAQCVEDVEEFMGNFQESQVGELSDLFKDIAESELRLYKTQKF